MSEITAVWSRRLARLDEIHGAILVRGPGTRSDTPLVAVTSSRLGRDVRLHRQVCQYVRQSLMDCERQGGALLVASGSAIEPWVDRAAELFGVPCQKLVSSPMRRAAPLVVSAMDSIPVSVDAATIALADRVDAVYVRRGGLIAKCLRKRLKTDLDASVRVAVMPTSSCAAQELIRDGTRL